MSIPVGAILVILILLALLVWAVRRLPVPEPFATAAIVIACVLAVIWLIQATGLMHLSLSVG